MKILTLNCGSSSVKSWFMIGRKEQFFVGNVEKVTREDSFAFTKYLAEILG